MDQYDMIGAAHSDALVEFGSAEKLQEHLELVHSRIGSALAGERLSVVLVALTQAVAIFGRMYIGDQAQRGKPS